MGIVELLLTGVSLSMDAFAVAMCKGLAMKKVNKRHALVIALFFGGFQALMPFVGYMLGSAFMSSISGIDHWIAFGLLAIIGGKMILEGVRDGKDDQQPSEDCPQKLDIKELFVLAVATSIDALIVGVAFAATGVQIGSAVALIGSITFVIAFAGVFIGNYFGVRFKNKAEIMGGIILVLIGLKVLLEHLSMH
ncbi:manganese efflux pump MntP family protein [Eubacteriales bacterium OttesenSCG-928-N13]|nr:manganese efflux pump MntP family protein [Eubacteriales bacterium OttesenSCG-928-N13]